MGVVDSLQRELNDTWPGLLEAWLVLTSVKYHGNLYILIPLNQRLALTRLRVTGPWTLKFPYVKLKTTKTYNRFKDSQNNGKKFHLLQRTHIWNVLPSIIEELSNFDAFRQKIKEDLKILQKINFDNDTCPVTNNDADVGYSTYICM